MTARLPKATPEDRPAGLSAFIEQENSMTLKTKLLRITWNASILLAIFTFVFANPASALPLEGTGTTLPDFAEFSRAVQNGDANALRGVYVPHVLATPVVQQPAGNAGFVSSNDGELTQFSLPSQYGNVGLLAHNYLSGELFFDLEMGQQVSLVYGDGRVETFVIDQILKYQAFEPNSPYSNFRDLSTDDVLTAEQVFRKAYTGDRRVTFQTCIKAYGLSTWGRIFVIATPSPEADFRVMARSNSR
jgi:hypothetical protein